MVYHVMQREGAAGGRPSAPSASPWFEANRVWLLLTSAAAVALLALGLAGNLGPAWGFGLLVLGGVALALATALAALLVFTRRGDTARLVGASRKAFAVGAGAYIVAVFALAGYYGYETFRGRIEWHWIIFGPLAAWALIAFDTGVYRKLVKKNLPTWHRFKRFIGREASDPAAMRKTFWDDVVLQRALFRTSKVRWFRHALIFWGFVMMFATELAAVVVRDAFPAFGWNDVWRAAGHPVRLAFDVAFDATGLMVMTGCVIALAWRIRVRGKPERKFADTPMSIFLLVVVVTGFLVEGWRIAQTSGGPAHGWSFVGQGFAYLLSPLVAPFGGVYQPLWLLHVIAACALIGYLPVTRLVHTCATPIGRLMNSQVGLLAARKIGVLSGLMGNPRAVPPLRSSSLSRSPAND